MNAQQNLLVLITLRILGLLCKIDLDYVSDVNLKKKIGYSEQMLHNNRVNLCSMFFFRNLPTFFNCKFSFMFTCS